MLAGNLAAIGVGGIIASLSSYIVGHLPLTRDLIYGIQWLLIIIGQWPEDFDFDITRAINAPATHHGRDSTDGDDDEKKSKDAIEAAEVENDESDNELDPVGLQKAFRFAAWSSVVLVGPFSYLGAFFPMN